MAGSIGSKCADPGCFAMVVAPDRYCLTHRKSNHHIIKTDKPRLALYDTTTWRNTRLAYLVRHPICNKCKQPASVVHHIKAARDYPELQLDWSNFESLCFDCHQRETGEEMVVRRRGLGLPQGKRFACQTTAIVGPPGAGKTTLAQKSAGSCDVIVDLDLIYAAFSMGTMHAANKTLLGYMIDVRRAAIDRLMAMPCPTPRAWLVYTAPLKAQRKELTDAGAEVLLLNPGRDECYARIAADPTRQANVEAQLERVDVWFDSFEPEGGAKSL